MSEASTICKSIDGKVLAALHLLSEGQTEGVNYMYFVRQNIMDGAVTLLDNGYAAKVKTGKDDAKYLITNKGQKYLGKILQYASKEFK